MAGGFKGILLLDGLRPMSDDHFRTVKCALAEDLNTTGNKLRNHDKVKFADLMTEKLKSDVALEKLRGVCKKIPDLKETADRLENEKRKLLRKKSRSHNESTTGQRMLAKNEDLQSKSATAVPLSKAVWMSSHDQGCSHGSSTSNVQMNIYFL